MRPYGPLFASGPFAPVQTRQGPNSWCRRGQRRSHLVKISAPIFSTSSAGQSGGTGGNALACPPGGMSNPYEPPLSVTSGSVNAARSGLDVVTVSLTDTVDRE